MKGIGTKAIIDQWAAQGIKLSQPATVVEIEEAETILGFQFPDDFKEFYLTLDGFVDWDWTSNMFSIWPLARIIEEYNNESDKSFVVFADFLINAHHIGFVKGQNGVFKNSDAIPEIVASTFSEVIFLINTDNDILY